MALWLGKLAFSCDKSVLIKCKKVTRYQIGMYMAVNSLNSASFQFSHAFLQYKKMSEGK